MRAHHVPNFPDPDSHGTFSITLTAGGVVQVNGIDFSGPAFTAAATTCQFDAVTPPGPITQSQRRKVLAFAGCMRHHGFPEWADPTFPTTGGILGGGGPYGKKTPGIPQAVATCNRIVYHLAGG
jgi:hypothetical protein